MDKYVQANRDYWNHLVDIHAASEFYGLEEFKKGRCSLDPEEVREVGNVSGQSLLHLQCHFGQDTLSWARRGARATGVDFSEKAIDYARKLAKETNLPADFVCAEFSDLPSKLSGQFDIVFTSGGVLTWLPDLTIWSRAIGQFVRPGGFFYIREFHPFAYVFLDEEKGGVPPSVYYPYFERQQPLALESNGSYADRNADIRFNTFEWPHPISSIINALIESGLRIDFLHEFPYSSYNSHPFLRQSDDGRWRYPEKPDSIPLMFSLKASRV